VTALFALLAACGAAGVAYSLLAQNRGGRAGASFAEALSEADGPSQDLARRLELLEEKVRLLESASVSVPSSAAREEEAESGPEPELPPRQAARRTYEAGSLSGRMQAVWEASDRNKGPLEIARDLKIGVSEVELALKVRKLKPVRG